MSLQRHRTGSGKLNQVLATASTAITIGSILTLVSNAVVPQGTTAYAADTLAGVQEGTHDAFIGIAADQRLASNTTAGNIAYFECNPDDEFEFPCADADVLSIGQLMGVGNTTGNKSTGTLQTAATSNLAIARLSRVKAANATNCFVTFFSTIRTGGPQAAT
jgi:hypothetical protein